MRGKKGGGFPYGQDVKRDQVFLPNLMASSRQREKKKRRGFVPKSRWGRGPLLEGWEERERGKGVVPGTRRARKKKKEKVAILCVSKKLTFLTTGEGETVYTMLKEKRGGKASPGKVENPVRQEGKGGGNVFFICNRN